MKNYKTKKQKEAFFIGMLTMLIVNIGLDLFGMGSWITYVGFFLILLGTLNVFVYVGKTKDHREIQKEKIQKWIQKNKR